MASPAASPISLPSLPSSMSSVKPYRFGWICSICRRSEGGCGCDSAGERPRMKASVCDGLARRGGTPHTPTAHAGAGFPKTQKYHGSPKIVSDETENRFVLLVQYATHLPGITHARIQSSCKAGASSPQLKMKQTGLCRRAEPEAKRGTRTCLQVPRCKSSFEAFTTTHACSIPGPQLRLEGLEDWH